MQFFNLFLLFQIKKLTYFFKIIYIVLSDYRYLFGNMLLNPTKKPPKKVKNPELVLV